MIRVEDLSFHESDVRAMNLTEGEGALVLDEVVFRDSTVTVVLRFEGLHGLTADGCHSVSEVRHEGVLGEVLCFALQRSSAELIVEWTDFQKRTRTIRAYSMNFRSVAMDVQPG